MPTPAVVELGMRVRFRGLERRRLTLLEGPAGWAEWSPFEEYPPTEAAVWLAATREAAIEGWPAPVRDRIPVNVTVPAIGPDAAAELVRGSGCRTAKIKVGEPGQHLADDLDRVVAVRSTLGAEGRIRVDANGAWSVDQAADALAALAGHGLEYAEQPCAQVEELAALRVLLARRGVDVAIAADESIRRSGDPERVVALGAADVAVLKVQPLGGVRACLELAERLGLPVVVSSALESSVGIAAGLALAAALPDLPFACGLNTVALFTDDVVAEPLVAVDGAIEVRRPAPTAAAMTTQAAAPAVRDRWLQRLEDCGGWH